MKIPGRSLRKVIAGWCIQYLGFRVFSVSSNSWVKASPRGCVRAALSALTLRHQTAAACESRARPQPQQTAC